MLLGFKVANFRSLRDLQELSLYRATRLSDQDPRWRRKDVSTVAAIYGANASGKSTVVDALAYLRGAVRDSYRDWPVEGGTARECFLLEDEAPDRPSQFEIEFVAGDGVTYQYGFEVDDRRVVTEHLYAYRTSRRTLVFDRSRQGSWRFGPSFRGPAQQIQKTTRDNALFLSVAAASGNETTRAAYVWITDQMRHYHASGYRQEHRRVMSRLSEDDNYARVLRLLVCRADLGVSDIRVVEQRLSEAERSEVERLVGAIADGDEAARMLTRVLDEREHTLQLAHLAGSRTVDLPFNRESDGTHALISFASLAADALGAGLTCVVDEIDASLHPLLVRELVRVFQNPLINPLQAQLIFTTHDVSLLDQSDPKAAVDRDQMWIVDKDAAGASSLIGVSEFGLPRQGMNLGRGYLTGRFGGVPQTSIVDELLARAAEELAPT